MSKYSFERMGPEKFEELGQALLENLFRIEGKLIQFGDGKDGAREATWSQPSDHPTYKQPTNETASVDKKWVFQVKFHDIDLRGWSGARSSIQSELASELKKITDKYSLGCHKYILITNVPFSGVRFVGTRDKITAICEEWAVKIPEIEIWDANDISRMLDNSPGVRAAFLETILPGDILSEILLNLRLEKRKSAKKLRGYLQAIVDAEIHARSEEAGDDGGLPLDRIFVDLNLRLESEGLARKSIEEYSGLLHGITEFEKANQTAQSISGDLEKPGDLIVGSFWGEIFNFLANRLTNRI